MWTLVRETIRYYRTPLVVASSVALLAGCLVAVAAALSPSAPRPLAGFLASLFPILVTLAAASVAAAMAGFESKERRLLMLVPLPVDRRQIAAARALAPTVVLLAAIAVGAAFLTALLLVSTPQNLRGDLARFLFLGAQLTFIVQLPLATMEVLVRAIGGAARPRRVLGVVMPTSDGLRIGALVLMALAAMVWVEIFAVWPMPKKVLSVLALTVAVSWINYRSFPKRPSFAG